MEISIKRVSYLSSLGFIAVLALACASSGCVTVEEDVHVDCGDEGDTDVEDGDTTVVVTDDEDAEPEPEPEQQPEPETWPEGPIVPMAAPYLSSASLPTASLTAGTVVALRVTVTARAEADVVVRKLTFGIGIDGAFEVASPKLRIVGMGSDLASESVIRTGASLCGLPDTSGYRCASVALMDDLVVAAGTSVTLDLRLNVYGPLTSGDSLTTSVARDVQGPQEGPLVGIGLAASIKDGNEDGVLWSNDGVWFYNAHSIAGIPWAHTLARS